MDTSRGPVEVRSTRLNANADDVKKIVRGPIWIADERWMENGELLSAVPPGLGSVFG
jgi:hypothetical protein